MSGSGRPAETSRVVLPRRGFLLLILLTVFWGANWPVIKTALEELQIELIGDLATLLDFAGDYQPD